MKYKVLILFCLVYNLTFAQQVSPSVTKYLENHSRVNVLLELKSKADLSQINESLTKKQKTKLVFESLQNTAKNSQSKIISLLRSMNISFRSYYIANIITCSLSNDELKILSREPEIKSFLLDESISLDRSIDLSASTLSQRGPMITWGLERIEVEKVWQSNIKGQGVTVAGEDTGYKWDVTGIKEKYRGYSTTKIDHNYNWHDAIHQQSPLSADSLNPCGYNLIEPCDDHDHGTHTVGTMVGSTNTEAYGVAPEAKWIGCRNMERGNGALSTYIECFEFFLAPTDLENKNPNPDLSPSVINNSWYCSREEGCDTSNFAIMEEVVDHLTKAGIVVVVSAGNSGQFCGSINAPPAIFNSSFAVGAFAPNDTISYFSSSGPVLNYKEVRIKPDVVAPGSDVLSRVRSGDLVAWNGTSMAGPHVAGLVALIISAYPALDGQVDKIKQIIRESARSAEANINCLMTNPKEIPNHVYGYGKIMASESVRRAILLKNTDLNKISNSFNVFPNPTNEWLNIERNSNSKELILIQNTLGVTLRVIQADESTISLSEIPSGVYYLVGLNSNQTAKILKL